MTLETLTNQFFYGTDYAPNPPPVDEIIDSGALLSDFLAHYQEAGGDVGTFDEQQWSKLLVERFGVDPDELPDFLETLASWGVVDNVSGDED